MYRPQIQPDGDASHKEASITVGYSVANWQAIPGRAMRLFCWIFILSVAIVSPVFLDIYPFSVFPMFSDNASEYVVVEVTDADGEELNAADYGLRKTQLAIRSQRYGHRLDPCYFDDHDTFELEKLTKFLSANFPDEQYPIVVRCWTRGFDQSTRTIQNLTEPQQFRIDCVTGRLSSELKGQERSNAKTRAHTRTKLEIDHSNDQAADRLNGLQTLGEKTRLTQGAIR